MVSLKYIILLFVVLKLIKNLLDGYNEPKQKIEEPIVQEANNSKSNVQLIPIDQMVNYNNEKAIAGSLKSHYEELLSLRKVPEINPDVLYDHYYEIIEELKIKGEYNFEIGSHAYDVSAAKEYLHDLCRYYGNRN